jgi:hypothetical protein
MSQPPNRPQPLSFGRSGGDARSQIASTLSSGPRGLPPNIAQGIANLASRMASDDELLQRLRHVVAAEALVVPALPAPAAGAPDDHPDTDAAAAGPAQSAVRRGLGEHLHPHQHLANDVSPPSPFVGSDWDLVETGSAATPQPPPRAANDTLRPSAFQQEAFGARAASVAQESSSTSQPTTPDEARAIAELRHVFDQGTFVARSPSGWAGDSYATTPDDASRRAPAVRGEAMTQAVSPTTPSPTSGAGASLSLGGSQRVVEVPDYMPVVQSARFGEEAAVNKHSPAKKRASVTYAPGPRPEESPHAGGGMPPPPELGCSSQSRFFRGSPSAVRFLPHQVDSEAAEPAADVNGSANASLGGAVSDLWRAIVGSLFEPIEEATEVDDDAVDAPRPTRADLHAADRAYPSPPDEVVAASSGAMDATGPKDDPRRPPRSATHNANAIQQPHTHHQANVTDERFLIAAAMLVNSTLLYVLLTRSGGAGQTNGGFSDIVGRVADVVQRAFESQGSGYSVV